MRPRKGRVLTVMAVLTVAAGVLAGGTAVEHRSSRSSGSYAPSRAGVGVSAPLGLEDALEHRVLITHMTVRASRDRHSTISFRSRSARAGAILPNIGTSVWDRLVRCESPDRGWRYGAPGVGIDPGYPFEGGPNFAHSTWIRYGGRSFAEHAWDATREEQIVIAERCLAVEGWGAWPTCSRKLGLR